MKLEYLIHLAEMRSIDIHPRGWKATLALIEALELQPGNWVLEIGCGTGGTIVRVLKDFPVKICGVEILPEMLSAAVERLRYASISKDVFLVRGSGAALPYPENCFDKVYAESVLGYQDVAVVTTMLGEVQRVLKPSGLFVANEAIWNPLVEAETVAEINRTCEADFGLRQATDLAWDISDWIEAIQAAGFQIYSANLLGEHQTKYTRLEQKRLGKESVASRLLNRYYQVRSYLSPRLVVQHISYRKLLQKHKEDGRFVEERLFILKKI